MSTFDPKESRPIENRPKKGEANRAVRPRDAATLILIREESGGPRVLMGKRSAGHDFMPDMFVFPGGRIDRSDYRIQPASDLHPDVMGRLVRAGSNEVHARALALTAIRETWEETGLIVGRKSDDIKNSKSVHWKPFLDRGIAPSLDGLDLVGRAITPPYRHKRFDARFFMASADEISMEHSISSDASGELLELHWFTFSEARELELPGITRAVIQEVEDRRNRKAARHETSLFAYTKHGKQVQGKM